MRFITIFIFCCLFLPAKAQTIEELDSMTIVEFIDTVFIDKDEKNWSTRIYSNVKEQRLIFKTSIDDISLIPNNPYGIGLGVATKKLVVDIGLNLKSDNNHTNRFDLQAHFMHKHHQMDFFLQHYRGFNVQNKNSESSLFRDDILLQSSGIRYLYVFNANEYSISAIKTGLAKQKKSSWSFEAGGFIIQLRQKADSTFIDEKYHSNVPSQALIVNSSSIGAGFSAGFLGLIVLPKNFFIGLSCVTGLGLSYNVIETTNDQYHPNNPLIYQLGINADIGYNTEKVYVNFSIYNNLYGTNYSAENKGLYNQINAKLAVGFKYAGNKK